MEQPLPFAKGYVISAVVLLVADLLVLFAIASPFFMKDTWSWGDGDSVGEEMSFYYGINGENYSFNGGMGYYSSTWTGACTVIGSDIQDCEVFVCGGDYFSNSEPWCDQSKAAFSLITIGMTTSIICAILSLTFARTAMKNSLVIFIMGTAATVLLFVGAVLAYDIIAIEETKPFVGAYLLGIAILLHIVVAAVALRLHRMHRQGQLTEHLEVPNEDQEMSVI